MNKFTTIVSLSLVAGLFSGVVFANSFESYFLKKEKELEITVDTRDPEDSASFSFADYDIDAPAACRQANVFCHEKTIIKAHIEKEWEVIPVPAIWDEALTPQEFATFYPDLEEDQIINDWSNPTDKWITQRVLYERGLLDVFPTGKIGFKTEEAIADLQYFKGIEEIDEQKGIVVIGPQTIKELNKLKARMEDPNFVSRSPLPHIPNEERTAFHQKRISQISSELQRREALPVDTDPLAPQLPIIKPENNGNMIRFSGEATIKVEQ